jgi:predicted enzyme related to lactoylglutathione lyase
VEENGGKIIVAKTLIFDIGNFAVIQDPQGAVISIMETLEEDWDEED